MGIVISLGDSRVTIKINSFCQETDFLLSIFFFIYISCETRELS